MNQKGSILFSTLVLMPMLLAVTLVIAAAFLLLRQYSHDLHNCRVSVLSANEKMAENLEQLLALNPQATALREERRLLEAAAKTGSGGYGQAAVLARLAVVIAKQAALRAKQLSLIMTAEQFANLRLQKMKSQFSQNFAHQQRLLLGTASKKFNSRVPLAKLRLIASPLGDASPSYETVPNFSQQQEITIDWKIDLKGLIPEWFGLKDQSVIFSGQCSGTISKGGRKWQSHLTVGSQLSNLF